jgi:hypothetical protein
MKHRRGTCEICRKRRVLESVFGAKHREVETGLLCSECLADMEALKATGGMEPVPILYWHCGKRTLPVPQYLPGLRGRPYGGPKA